MHIVGQLLDGLSREDTSDRLLRDLPALLQRSLDGDPQETECIVRKDLRVFALDEVAVEPRDLLDLRARDLLPFLTERLAHLHEALARVYQLNFAVALR